MIHRVMIVLIVALLSSISCQGVVSGYGTLNVPSSMLGRDGNQLTNIPIVSRDMISSLGGAQRSYGVFDGSQMSFNPLDPSGMGSLSTGLGMSGLSGLSELGLTPSELSALGLSGSDMGGLGSSNFGSGGDFNTLGLGGNSLGGLGLSASELEALGIGGNNQQNNLGLSGMTSNGFGGSGYAGLSGNGLEGISGNGLGGLNANAFGGLSGLAGAGSAGLSGNGLSGLNGNGLSGLNANSLAGLGSGIGGLSSNGIGGLSANGLAGLGGNGLGGLSGGGLSGLGSNGLAGLNSGQFGNFGASGLGGQGSANGLGAMGGNGLSELGLGANGVGQSALGNLGAGSLSGALSGNSLANLQSSILGGNYAGLGLEGLGTSSSLSGLTGQNALGTLGLSNAGLAGNGGNAALGGATAAGSASLSNLLSAGQVPGLSSLTAGHSLAPYVNAAKSQTSVVTAPNAILPKGSHAITTTGLSNGKIETVAANAVNSGNIDAKELARLIVDALKETAMQMPSKHLIAQPHIVNPVPTSSVVSQPAESKSPLVVPVRNPAATSGTRTASGLHFSTETCLSGNSCSDCKGFGTSVPNLRFKDQDVTVCCPNCALIVNQPTILNDETCTIICGPTTSTNILG